MAPPTFEERVMEQHATEPAESSPHEGVAGEFFLQFKTGEECAPHSGSCLTGRASGDLAGEVLIKVYDGRGVSGSARALSASTAEISISCEDGRLDGVSAGILDTGSGEHRNVTMWCGGSGRYASANGYVIVDGPIDLKSGVERSRYEGVLVFDMERGCS
jgi:hypothetical protein